MNEDLLAAYAVCRSIAEETAARVGLWQAWADGEREAHRVLNEGAEDAGS